MSQAENQILPGQEVTVEEIDNILQEVASRCRFSGPNVRRKYAAVDVDEVLGSLYRRLSSRDAKWLTRMILKSYHPVQLPAEYFLKKVHFLLPHFLLFQDSLEAAVELLTSPSLKLFPPQPQSDFANLLGDKALEHLIHIDITKGQDCIQIFSKSGKDSTLDRAGIHDVIKRSLAIGEPHCKVSRRCILEGELLVWDDRDGKILEFHKLRKFLSRSDIFIGTELDSQPKPYEHLMIVFFDILLLDDDICISKPHRLRRLLLKETVKITPGRAEISEQEIIDFSRLDAIRRLQQALARSIAERWEGYVIKACDEPYFSVLMSESADGFCRWIKLKKDYIPGLGDTVDFALIGARYDAKDAPILSTKPQLSWTHFFIGCLDNKEDVIRLSALPRFRIVDMIGARSLSVNDIQVLNQWGKFVACDVDSNSTFDCYSIHNSLPNMDIAFKTPFVVELLGSGFEKPSNAQYYTLRFPRVLKIHWDRSFEDAISFVELQDLAAKARAVPADELEENAVWFEKVAGTNRKTKYIVDKSQTTSTSSFTCTSPLSKSPSLISLGLTPPSVNQAPASLIRGNMHNRRPFSQSSTTSSLNKCKRTASPVHPLMALNSASNLNFTSPNLPHALRLKRLKLSAIMDLDQAPQYSLRARGSPIPRAWASSVDSHSANPSSQPGQTPSGLGSGFTTPLRENSNFLSREISTRAAATFEEAWKFIEEAQAGAEEKVEEESEEELEELEEELEPAAGLCHIPSPEHEPMDFEVYFGINPDDEAPVSTSVLRNHPISPLSTVPIYCGESGFQEDSFRKAPREFIFSAKHFVKSLGFTHTRRRLRLSNPSAAINGMALGIVLVDIKDPSRVLAMQLYDMGNLLAAELSQPQPALPTQGKIFFLDSRILKAGGQGGIDNEMFTLNDWWSIYGTQYFYATISWREGGNAAQVVSGPRRIIDQINEHTTRASAPGGRAAASIVNLYEPSEVEALGEFVSVNPTVHLDGDRYYRPYRPARHVPDGYAIHNGSYLPIPRDVGQIDGSVSRYSSSAFV
ncbi:hypothetical protein EYB25_004762 [Talaromyces marneffei]|nr:hypothetical protein EYB25_004762 [Talaromyces marneffei]